MSRSWWRKLFGSKQNPIRKAPIAKLDLSRARLEERLTPAVVTFNNVTNPATLDFLLDSAGEQLTITSIGSSKVNYATTGTFSGDASGNSVDLTVAPGIPVLVTVGDKLGVANTKVVFADSGANAYPAARHTITLNDGSAGVVFNGATPLGGEPLSVQTDGIITIAAGALVTNGGNITFISDKMDLGGTLAAGVNTVTLRPVTNGAKIDLGSIVDTTAATLELSDAELDFVTAGVLTIGTTSGGAVNGTAAVTGSGSYKALTLASSSDVTFNKSVDGGFALTVNTGGGTNFFGTVGGTTPLASLKMDAAGLTRTAANITTTGTQDYGDQLALFADQTITSTTNGPMTFAQIDNNFKLTINAKGAINFNGKVGSLVSLNSLTATASSPLTVAADITAAGDIVLTAGETADSPVFADKLTVNAGIKVESAGGNVTLNAGDDIVLNNASLVKADTAGKTVTLTAASGDLDASGAITIVGVNSVVATNLAMSALTGIGSLANPVTTTVSNLEAQTTTGGIFVDNTGDLSIGNVLVSLKGVRTTTSGGVQVTTTGILDLAEATGVYIVQAATGDVFLKAGAGKDLTASVNNDAVQALKGSVILQAGQDIKLGTTAANFDNDVDADLNISFIAGRDIVIDTNSDVRADSFGNATGGQVTFSAGRHITLGPTAANSVSVTAQLGTVSLTTGAAGVFTLTNGAQVTTTGGDVIITADNVVIDALSAISASTGCVLIQQKTLSNKIDLGGADGAGTLGLTNAELGKISGADIHIGQVGGGAISITQKITLAQPLELISGAGGITETGLGALEVDDLILVTTGTVTMNGDNKVKNLAASSGGDLSFKDKIALTITELTICGDKITGLTASGNVTLIGDTITISKGVSADCVILKRGTAGAFDLGTTVTDASLDNITAKVLQIGDAAADSITISAAITIAKANVPVVDLRTAQTIANTGGTLAADSLVFAAGQAVTLTGANTFGTIAGTSGGKLEITSSGKVTVGSVTNCDPVTIKGINSTGNDIVLIADDLELVEAVTATGACVTLTPPAGGKINLGSEVGGSLSLKDTELAKITAAKLQIGSATAGPITIPAAINPTSLTHLYSGSSITGTGVITVANLAITSDDSVSLTGANDVDVLAGTAKNSFTFTDTDDLKIDSVAACVLTEKGVTSTTGDVTLNTGKLLTLNADVKAANTITLNTTANGVSQTGGSVLASGLELKGSGTYTLTSATNDVATIAAAVSGPVNYRDANTLAVGTVNTVGISTTGGDATLKTGGALTLAQSINVGAGSVVLDVAAGGINQTGGALTAKNLELLVTGNATLNQVGNDVDVIAATTTGNLTFYDTDGFVIGQVNATKGITAVGQRVTLTTGSGGVTQNAGMIITANGLELFGDFTAPVGTGTYTLTEANKINVLAANTNADVSVTAANALTVGAVGITTGITTNAHALALKAPGINQTNAIFSKSIDLQGNGIFNLPDGSNDVEFFTSSTTGGKVFFRDTDDLTIGATGINTGGQPLTIQTGSSFTLPAGATIDVAPASGLIQAGLNDASKADTSTTITIAGVINAHPVNGFQIDGGIGSNSFDITPSKTTPLFIFGNSPIPAEVSKTIVGDSLAVQTAALGATVGLFNVDKTNGNGVFTFTDPNNSAIEKARPVIYNSIENISGFSIQAAAVQTSATTYNLVVAGKFNGGPFLGGFSGTLPPVAPFLVSPNLTNPLGPFTSPQVAIGDVDGDGLPDLVVGFGLNSGSPLVTVVDGIRIFNSSKAGQPLVLADIMTQFYAYHPAFQGGVFVAAGDTDGDGRSNIITGAGAGGGPHVKVFSVDPTRDPDGTFKTKSNSNAKVDSEFFAYNASFTGGVRVAAGDVTNDGNVDIVTAAGAGGGPHVRVFKPNGALEREFFAYSANFLGGVYVDVGDYNSDGFGDILTGAGFGGGPHIRVFDGQTLTNTGAQVILNEFFDDLPSTINPTPFQDDASAFSAGVTGVGFGNFEDTTSQLDIFVGSGLGRRTKVRIYQNGSHTPVSIAGKPFDFLSNGTNYLYDNRRDGAHVAVGGAFIS